MSFLLGIVVGFIYKTKIQTLLERWTSEASQSSKPSVNDIPIITEKRYNFGDEGFIMDENKRVYAHPELIIMMMKECAVSIPTIVKAEAGYVSDITIENPFNDMIPEVVQVFIEGTKITKQDKKDKDFKSFLAYLMFCKVWNHLYIAYPEEIPHKANENDSFVSFAEINAIISKYVG